jgi:hypothetical protein
MRTRSMLLLLVIGLIGAQAFAQNAVWSPTTSDTGGSLPKLTWPRPFVYGGVGLGGSGYAPLSGRVGAGLRIDRTHLIWTVSAAYDNSYKTNDHTINNSSGLDWREAVGIYTFHDTVTSIDPALTALQESHRSVAAFVECTT